jgi:hypothetical protein
MTKISINVADVDLDRARSIASRMGVLRVGDFSYLDVLRISIARGLMQLDGEIKFPAKKEE